MRDDLDPDSGRATQGGRRRAPEPDEAPRRRRRSMEASGGVSVSDLVERHTGSRTNLQPVPPPPHRPAEIPDDPPRHVAPPESPAKHSTGEFPAGPAADVAPTAPRTGRRRAAAEEDPRSSLAEAFGHIKPEPPRAILHPPIPADVAVPPTARPVEQVHRIVEVRPDSGRSGHHAIPMEPVVAPDPRPVRPQPPQAPAVRRSIPMDPAPVNHPDTGFGGHGPRPVDPGQHTGQRPIPMDPAPTAHRPAPQPPRPAQRPIPMDPAPAPGPRPGPADPYAAHGDPARTGQRPLPAPGDHRPDGRRPDPVLPPRPQPDPAYGYRPAEAAYGPESGHPAAGRTGQQPLPTEARYAVDNGRPGQRPVPPEAAYSTESGHTGQRPVPENGHLNGIAPGQRPIPAEAGYAGDNAPRGGHTGQRPIPAEAGYSAENGHPNGIAPGRTGQRPIPTEAGYPGRRPGPSEAAYAAENGAPRPNRPADETPSVDAVLSGRQGDTGGHPRLDPVGQATGHYPPPGQDSLPGNQALPKIPRQLPPGQSSMPPRPDLDAAPRPPAVSPEELIGMTTEMEAIGEATQKRRRVDQTLARFSKVHDELKAEERARKSKFGKLNPWAAQDAELDEHLEELAAVPGEPTALVAPVAAVEDEEPVGTRLQVKKARKQSQTSKVAKIAAGTMAALILVCSGVGWGFKKWTNDSIRDVRGLDLDSKSIQNAEAQRGDENFLLIGSDTREGAAGEDGVGSADSVPGARSDTMMIAHVPADRSRVVFVSFPRDLEINRPECERFDAKTSQYTGEKVPGQKTAKMNTAYQVGGPLCATKVIQDISGLRITRFVGIDFNGFKGMVDAVDGVNVCVEKPMFDTLLNKWIVKDAGKAVELRGDQALDFVRARHVRGDVTSDYGRIKRQQRFLSSLLRKAMSSQVLLDPGKLTDFAGAFAESTFGDNIDLDALLNLGQSMQGLEAGRVTFITVPTVGDANARGNEVLLKEPTDALFRAIVNDQPLPGEKPTGTQPPTSGSQQALPQSAPLRQQTPVDPKTLKIQVLNGGNSTGGIARKTADKLSQFGYQIVNVNAGPSVPKTVVRYGKGKEAEARTLASSVPGAVVEEDAASVGAVVLIIGPEYKGEVVAPSGQVAPPEPEKLPSNLSTVNAGDVACA